MGQIIDTETAKEFMTETLAKVDADQLVEISRDLQHKSVAVKSLIDAGLTPDSLYQLLRLLFSTRRKAKKILEATDQNRLIHEINILVSESGPVKDRFERFYNTLDGLDNHVRHDIAGELLHFSNPDKYWLWSYWMWNPKTETGALSLVTEEEFKLDGATVGDTYMNVGRAIAFVHEVGEAAGFQTISKSLFGTDVYLACVYVVYAYTVLRMRMTQEFNKVMPQQIEFVRRILGVKDMEEIMNLKMAPAVD